MWLQNRLYPIQNVKRILTLGAKPPLLNLEEQKRHYRGSTNHSTVFCTDANGVRELFSCTVWFYFAVFNYKNI